MTVRRHEIIEMSIFGPGVLQANSWNAINRTVIVPELPPGSHPAGSLCVCHICLPSACKCPRPGLLKGDGSVVHRSGICSPVSS